MPGKTLTSQAQELVLNSYKYFELEKRNGGPLGPLFSVQEFSASADTPDNSYFLPTDRGFYKKTKRFRVSNDSILDKNVMYHTPVKQPPHPPPDPNCPIPYEYDCRQQPSDHDDYGSYGWNDGPSIKSFILYSVVTTVICSFGIFGNILSLMVLRRKELVGSVYTYLAVLAAADLALSIIFFLGGLARGAFYSTNWTTYDALIGLPLGGAINSMCVMATVGVTIDRVLYLWNPVQCTKPKFCNPRIARMLMVAAVLLAVILNLPYCFIFEKDPDGYVVTSDFFHSRLYVWYNWFMLVILTIIPGLILILGNGFLIFSLQKARRITLKCNGKRRLDHRNLTITLISIIVLFVVAEIPSNLVSKTRAVTLIFFGYHAEDNSGALEVIRELCTLLGALNVTVNFLFYYLFCPAFCRALRKTFRKGPTKKLEKVRVNVIVLNENMKMSNMKAKVMEITKNIGSPLFKKEEIKYDLENCSSKEIDSEYVEIIDDYKATDDYYSSSLEPRSYENESTATIVRDAY